MTKSEGELVLRHPISVDGYMHWWSEAARLRDWRSVNGWSGVEVGC